jgi:DNA polymerase III subunit gamma/tau
MVIDTDKAGRIDGHPLMPYQTLYLKYRSQRFADLVGQDAIARTLQNAVEQGRVAHAYLFSGGRGTGKTSTARILAKAVNCVNRQGAEPCGECPACLEIASGAAVDLIEIDAASNRGIDEIRELRDRVKYLPASLRVKVYIIDEAHMLTTEAFNALLKTLEEPPAHAVFVLATTEPHKIPLTVASRTQRFDFRRIETAAIATRLAQIAQVEGVTVDPAALALLARMAQGSMRDGITFLDQLLSRGAESLTVERTRELLGLADPDLLVDLLTAVTSGDAAATLSRLQGFYEAGGDMRQLVRGLLQAIREAALRSVGHRQAEEFGSGVGQRLEKVGRAAGRSALLDLWKGLMEMEPELRKGADARLLLELTLLRSMNPAVPSSLAAAPAVGATMAAAPVSGPAAAPAPPVAAASPAAPAPAAPASGATGADLRWEAMKQKLPLPVASLLKEAWLGQAGDGLVRIEFRYPAHLEQMQKPEKKDMLTAAARDVFGSEVRVELAAGEGHGAAAPPSASAPPTRQSVADDPLVRDAMNRFDAVSVKVVPRGR